jgi:K+-sensing histidine kinase KdpD
LSSSSIPRTSQRKSWFGDDSFPTVTSATAQYAIAVLSVAAITAVRYALNPYLELRPVYAFYLLAVAATAFHAGFGPAIAALALSALAATYLFDLPAHSFVPHSIADWIGLTVCWSPVRSSDHRARTDANGRDEHGRGSDGRAVADVRAIPIRCA